ncbi:MAG TPA: hypothetical protein H9717_03390 [Candidatus Eisenbergiella merdipullorum]|uniref:Uncharacterized protein n=1 Tax=Candidatus Eisenbergiella merdipullorum TaxID=2838553 RepID=A0A9D2I5K5_9FIRM|nr:hypothetical protein [Candidatus Eisenbergiella merdipullorum]
MKQAALKHGVQEKSREKTETAAAGRGRSPRLPETVEVDRNLPIQVAALCDTTGQIHPLWFRYADEDNRVRKVEIGAVLSRKTVYYVGLQIEQFICASMVEGRRRTYEIRYSVESHRWHFFRMID